MSSRKRLCGSPPISVPVLRFVRLTDRAKSPRRKSVGAAGFDLSAAEAAVIAPGARARINTDLQLELPEGTYGRIAPRSGLALRSITVDGGVVDGDYRGNVGVIVVNNSDAPFTVSVGDRVAQLILEKICHADVAEVVCLDSTARGSDGFGSSGV